jgi:hypothetical protein
MYGHLIMIARWTLIISDLRAEARRPLWNEIRFCERAIANSRAFLSVNSRLFRLVWRCLIIKYEMSRYVKWIANWWISQCKHTLMKWSYPSINLRVFLLVHSGLLCIAVLINRMMTLTQWKSESLLIEVVLV